VIDLPPYVVLAAKDRNGWHKKGRNQVSPDFLGVLFLFWTGTVRCIGIGKKRKGKTGYCCRVVSDEAEMRTDCGYQDRFFFFGDRFEQK
jgi:hypothetical protein